MGLPNIDLKTHLVEGLDFRRSAVRELDVGEVPLRARDVLRGRHEVVPRLRSDGVAAFKVPERERERREVKTIIYKVGQHV